MLIQNQDTEDGVSDILLKRGTSIEQFFALKPNQPGEKSSSRRNSLQLDSDFWLSTSSTGYSICFEFLDFIPGSFQNFNSRIT